EVRAWGCRREQERRVFVRRARRDHAEGAEGEWWVRGDEGSPSQRAPNGSEGMGGGKGLGISHQGSGVEAASRRGPLMRAAPGADGTRACPPSFSPPPPNAQSLIPNA